VRTRSISLPNTPSYVFQALQQGHTAMPRPRIFTNWARWCQSSIKCQTSYTWAESCDMLCHLLFCVIASFWRVQPTGTNGSLTGPGFLLALSRYDNDVSCSFTCWMVCLIFDRPTFGVRPQCCVCDHVTSLQP